jgi:N-acetylmuramoyl-L-alanine amidase
VTEPEIISSSQRLGITKDQSSRWRPVGNGQEKFLAGVDVMCIRDDLISTRQFATRMFEADRHSLCVKASTHWLVMAFLLAEIACSCKVSGATSGPLRNDVHTIIIHTIGGPSCVGGQVVYSGAPGNAARWKSFFDRDPVLGIHFIVDRTGTVLSSTAENRMAKHARGNNAGTIGIELVHDGDGKETFGDAQIHALIGLIKSIRKRHSVPIENIKSHAEVDSRRFPCGRRMIKARVDPGANFPWAELRGALRSSDP